MSQRDPRERNDDGSARDPVAFQKSLRDDPAVLAELEALPEAKEALLGADLEAMQEYLRVEYRASTQRAVENANRSQDALRVDATVPRDNVELYKRLHAVGLQYGPAFQLLTNVRVPDESEAAAKAS